MVIPLLNKHHIMKMSEEVELWLHRHTQTFLAVILDRSD
jgi:hypothetical protein